MRIPSVLSCRIPRWRPTCDFATDALGCTTSHRHPLHPLHPLLPAGRVLEPRVPAGTPKRQQVGGWQTGQGVLAVRDCQGAWGWWSRGVSFVGTTTHVHSPWRPRHWPASRGGAVRACLPRCLLAEMLHLSAHPSAAPSSPALNPLPHPLTAAKQAVGPTLPRSSLYRSPATHPRLPCFPPCSLPRVCLLSPPTLVPSPCFAPAHCSMFVHRVAQAKYEPWSDDLKPITHVTVPSCSYTGEKVGGWVVGWGRVGRGSRIGRGAMLR